jgi:hypothetical protein
MKQRMFLSIFLLLSSLPLSAQDKSAEQAPSSNPSQVRWSLGLGVISSPRPYVGAKNSVLPIPLVELSYKKFYVQGIRAGFHLFEKGDVTFDARVRVVFAGLDPEDSPALEGMSERKSSVEGGFALDWKPGKYLLSATAFTDLLGRSGGQQVGLDLSRTWTFAGYRWGLTPSVGVVWQSTGRAKVVDMETNAKLKVSFFGPFWGNYWIIDLDPDYRWAVVGEPKRKYLWILSRTRSMDDELYGQILARLPDKGYDPNGLQRTVQLDPQAESEDADQ